MIEKSFQKHLKIANVIFFMKLGWDEEEYRIVVLNNSDEASI